MDHSDSEYEALMGDLVTLTLPRNFIGQLVDGLDVLIEQWEYTAEHLAFGAFRSDMLIRECKDAEEARWIAGFYKLIRERITQQRSQEA